MMCCSVESMLTLCINAAQDVCNLFQAKASLEPLAVKFNQEKLWKKQAQIALRALGYNCLKYGKLFTSFLELDFQLFMIWQK